MVYSPWNRHRCPLLDEFQGVQRGEELAFPHGDARRRELAT